MAGYHELSETISEFQLGKREKTETIVDVEYLAKFCRGNWTVLTGTASGEVRHALENEGIDAAVRVVNRLRDAFGAENVVVESVLNTVQEQEKTALQLAEVARIAGVPLVATTGARVASAESLKLAHVLRAVRLPTLDEVEPYLKDAHAVGINGAHSPVSSGGGGECGDAGGGTGVYGCSRRICRTRMPSGLMMRNG